MIDADPPERAIDHEPDAAARRERPGDRGQPRARILEMMEHPAVVDIVEGAEREEILAVIRKAIATRPKT